MGKSGESGDALGCHLSNVNLIRASVNGLGRLCSRFAGVSGGTLVGRRQSTGCDQEARADGTSVRAEPGSGPPRARRGRDGSAGGGAVS